MQRLSLSGQTLHLMENVSAGRQKPQAKMEVLLSSAFHNHTLKDHCSYKKGKKKKVFGNERAQQMDEARQEAAGEKDSQSSIKMVSHLD